MRTLFSLSLLAAGALFLAGCSDNPADPGSSTGGSFWPAKAGNTWTYASTLNYTVTAGNDTVINGKNYTVMMNTSAGPSLLRRDGNSYYTSDGTQDILFLKDDAVGTKWELDITVNGVPNHHEYTIEERGATKTVAGKEYKDVIRIRSKSSMTNPITGQPIVFNEGNLYYARNVGLLQTDYGPLGVVNLTSYTVN